MDQALLDRAKELSREDLETLVNIQDVSRRSPEVEDQWHNESYRLFARALWMTDLVEVPDTNPPHTVVLTPDGQAILNYIEQAVVDLNSTGFLALTFVHARHPLPDDDSALIHLREMALVEVDRQKLTTLGREVLRRIRSVCARSRALFDQGR